MQSNKTTMRLNLSALIGSLELLVLALFLLSIWRIRRNNQTRRRSTGRLGQDEGRAPGDYQGRFSVPSINVTSAILRAHPSHGTQVAPVAAWRRGQWGSAARDLTRSKKLWIVRDMAEPCNGQVIAAWERTPVEAAELAEDTDLIIKVLELLDSGE
jgi:hypothetical protein